MNKRKIIYRTFFILLLALFAMPKSLFSQYRRWNFNQFHFALQGGVAWPHDRFGTGHNLKFASYVNKGYNILLQGVYFYTPNYGIGLNLIFTDHPVNNDKLGQAYLNSNQAYTNVVANVSDFYIPIFTMGMFFQMPLNEYFAFTAALHVGTQTVIKPAGVVTATTLFSTIPFVETSDVETKFIIYYKFGVQFKIAKYIHGVIDAAYTGSTYQMKYYRNEKLINEYQHIGDVMYRLGIAYKFD